MLCGSPLKLSSSGTVICFSISSGAWPGKSVITVTWMSETSGKRLHGKRDERDHATRDEQQCHQHHEERLMQRKRDEPPDHR